MNRYGRGPQQMLMSRWVLAVVTSPKEESGAIEQ